MSAKIVIIEDDRLCSMVLEKSFKKLNCNSISCYNNGMDFLKSLNDANRVLPKVIIMDYHLPLMSGFQLLAYLKRNKELSNINVIIYSAFVDENRRITSLKAGALDFVEKKYSEETLRDFASKVREFVKTGVYGHHELPEQKN